MLKSPYRTTRQWMGMQLTKAISSLRPKAGARQNDRNHRHVHQQIRVHPCLHLHRTQVGVIDETELQNTLLNKSGSEPVTRSQIVRIYFQISPYECSPCSNSPRAKRPRPSEEISTNLALPSRINSLMHTPTAGDNLKPVPLKPHAT